MYEILNIEAAFFRPGNYNIKDLATFFKTAWRDKSRDSFDLPRLKDSRCFLLPARAERA